VGIVRIPKTKLDPTADKYAEYPGLFVEDCYRIAGEYEVEVAGLLKHMAESIAKMARKPDAKQEQLLAIIRCLCDAGYPPPS